MQGRKEKGLTMTHVFSLQVRGRVMSLIKQREHRRERLGEDDKNEPGR